MSAVLREIAQHHSRFVTRLERIWNQRPSLVSFEYGLEPETYEPDHLNRKEAARELRRLRKCGATFHKIAQGQYFVREA